LHQRYGIQKFIVVVPTLPIKAGARQFMSDIYTQKHFKEECDYAGEIDLQVLDAVKKKKKGKQYFPSAVREFVTGSNQTPNKIYVLLVNMALLTNSKMLTSDKYDTTIQGFHCPIDAIRATKPFLIIDEPHRFSKDQKTFEFITNEIQPQCIIRFGATYPTKTEVKGKGKTKTSVDLKDYQNLLYDLNACDAFNQHLIKGIAKEHLENTAQRDDKVKIMAVESKTAVRFSFIEKGKPNKTHELRKGDSLGLLAPDLEGITIEGIGKNFVELSNGQIKQQGEEFSTDIYASSYQKAMLRLAIDRHFESEFANFDRTFPIKTLALFFIDDIHSYRNDAKTEKITYLKNDFEALLIEKINTVLPTLVADNLQDYKGYLQATLQDIARCHAGYFSQDNSDSDEEIAKEVNEILFEKKKLLSIKNEDGTYNTRRFLFSKWTLKEGWDNPNVFTITKLRSSGSENSKLQEVGRGLRLPVDENGNRVSNEQFTLNYIIDFTEADFAEKLVREINAELPKGYTISDEKLQQVAVKLRLTKNELFKKLLVQDYIDMNRNIVIENMNQFFDEYPDFATGLNGGKVKDKNKEKDLKINIRPAVYNELKTLWEAINHKYLIFYDKMEENDYFKNELAALFSNGVFTEVYAASKREALTTTDDGKIQVQETESKQYKISQPLPYGEFLKRINKQTNIPIRVLHAALVLCNTKKTIEKDKINEWSAANFVSKFQDWKNKKLEGQFTYKKSNLQLKSTALTFANGSPRESLAQGRIGTKFTEGTPIDKYLYDKYAYDSPLERQNLLEQIDEVVVYGKIPRSSIAIPTITGQSYSPDFMYVVKKANGEKTLNIIVETKDMDNESNLRTIEEVKINCAKAFFEQLTIDGYKVAFHKQINTQRIKQIIDEVLETSA
jgi:type III restriction enzyme